jgi:hypothetical protein
MTTLCRAAGTDSQSDSTSFAETLQTAELYRANPGFGGSTLWTVEAPSSSDRTVLDLVDADESDPTDEDDDRDDAYRALSAALDRRVDAYSGLLDVLVPQHAYELAEAGYDWVLVPESYPAGTTTWVYVGSAALEMTEVV